MDSISISYEQLSQSLLDVGYRSVFIDGVDYHEVTRDISVAVHSIKDRKLTNTLYINGSPIKVCLEDDDIAPYYSNYIECRYVVTGDFAMEIDGEIAHFSENELCFISSSALHREYLKESDCVLIDFSISNTFFTERFLSSLAITPLQKLLRTNLLQTGQKEKYLRLRPDEADADSVKDLIFTILNEGRQQKVGYQDICRGYIIRLIDMLSSSHRHFSESESRRYKATLFESVSSYMEENLASITLERLAAAFHYQPNFINGLIKSFTGLTYSAFLISLRIEHAKLLLETSDLSVENIIWLAGYHNRGFFYRKFTEITGMSPAEYRKKAGKDRRPGA